MSKEKGKLKLEKKQVFQNELLIGFHYRNCSIETFDCILHLSEKQLFECMCCNEITFFFYKENIFLNAKIYKHSKSNKMRCIQNWDIGMLQGCVWSINEFELFFFFFLFFIVELFELLNELLQCPPPLKEKKKEKSSCDSAGSQLTMCPLFHLLMSRKLLLDWVCSPWPSWDHRGGSWLIWRTTRRKSSMAILRVYLACSVSAWDHHIYSNCRDAYGTSFTV